MFRECYFEYAGISSQPYNLIMSYVSNSNEDFDSGGKFDLKTDTLPRSHETLLYGKDYSAQPLSFEVEITNDEHSIPLKQMLKIKNWLFEQDGWKKLRLLDERRDYHLRCVFEPGEDIVDGTGYRGLRCTLTNISPFWYGEGREFVKTSAGNAFILSGTIAKNKHVFSFELPNNDSVDGIILPEIVVGINRSYSQTVYDYGASIIVETTNATTVADGLRLNDSEFVYPATSSVTVDTSYLNKYSFSYSWSQDSNTGKYYIVLPSDSTRIDTDYTEQPTTEQAISTLQPYGYYVVPINTNTGYAVYAKDDVTINTKYKFAKSKNHPELKIPLSVDTNNPTPTLKLHYGTNVCRIYYPWAISYVKFKYTPLYRLGAF